MQATKNIFFKASTTSAVRSNDVIVWCQISPEGVQNVESFACLFFSIKGLVHIMKSQHFFRCHGVPIEFIRAAEWIQPLLDQIWVCLPAAVALLPFSHILHDRASAILESCYDLHDCYWCNPWVSRLQEAESFSVLHMLMGSDINSQG